MVIIRFHVVFSVVFSSCFASCLAGIQCLDAQGSPVDWFIVYKLPRMTHSTNPLIKEGVAHLYMDVNQKFFKLSAVSLNDTHQAVGYTLQQVFSNAGSQDVLYMLYNDEFPDGNKTFSKGHTKGVVAMDIVSGFWLVHSVPKFPYFANGKYFWPENALHYGQSMLCISMDASQFSKVGQQLMYNNPGVYDYNIPTTFESQYPDFVKVANGGHVGTSPWNNTVQLVSLGAQQFTSFAKFSLFKQDLYSGWVAPYLEDDLYAETWMNGRGKLPSFCTGTYNVENVLTLSFDGVETFKETVDHSKWAITENKRWVCIGDINRMESQYTRAGGTVCGLIPAARNAFITAIEGVDRCNTTYWNKKSD